MPLLPSIFKQYAPRPCSTLHKWDSSCSLYPPIYSPTCIHKILKSLAQAVGTGEHEAPAAGARARQGPLLIMRRLGVLSSFASTSSTRQDSQPTCPVHACPPHTQPCPSTLTYPHTRTHPLRPRPPAHHPTQPHLRHLNFIPSPHHHVNSGCYNHHSATPASASTTHMHSLPAITHHTLPRTPPRPCLKHDSHPPPRQIDSI